MEAVGVAQRDDAAFGQDDEGIRPAHAIASGEDGLLKILLFGKAARNEVHENFTVAAGLEDGAFAFQFAAEFRGIGQIAVVGQRDLDAANPHDQRLGVLADRNPRGGVTHVADGPVALQFLTKRRFVVYVRHEPHARVQPDVLAVITCDARAFLPAMLEGVQTEIGHPSRFRMSRNTKNSAHTIPFVTKRAEKAP